MESKLRLCFAAFLIAAIYILIALSIKFYVDLIINWKMIWIVIVTLATLLLSRFIFEVLPIQLTKISKNTIAIKWIYKTIMIIATTGYLFMLLMFLDTKDPTNIKVCIISALMFIACSNLLSHGIFNYMVTCEKIKMTIS